MAAILFVQLAFFFLSALCVIWAGRVSPPYSDYIFVLALTIAGTALFNLLTLTTNNAASEIIWMTCILIGITGTLIFSAGFCAWAYKEFTQVINSLK